MEFFHDRNSNSLEEYQKNSEQCKCGRSTNLACNAEGCPCFDNLLPCWADPECECHNCNNRYGPRIMPRPKQKPCKCQGGCNSIYCPCWKRAASCLADKR